MKLNRKESTRKVREEGPDQNAINLSSKVLTTPQKSVLAKGPAFTSTPNDVDWLNVRRQLDSFINQLRYFANNAFRKGKEVQVAEVVTNQEQERVDTKVSGEPQNKEKQNWCNVQIKTDIK